jgi:hypothetical protein
VLYSSGQHKLIFTNKNCKYKTKFCCSYGQSVELGEIIIIIIFRKWDMGVRTGLSWLRIGTGGGHL